MNWDEVFSLLNEVEFFCFFSRYKKGSDAYSGKIFVANQPDYESGTYDGLPQIIIPKRHWFRKNSDEYYDSDIDKICSILLRSDDFINSFTIDKDEDEIIIKKITLTYKTT